MSQVIKFEYKVVMTLDDGTTILLLNRNLGKRTYSSQMDADRAIRNHKLEWSKGIKSYKIYSREVSEWEEISNE